MKVWLGAAAALSGAGTLVYLLVRQSRRGRSDEMPSKASETHSTKGSSAEGSEASQDTRIRKNDSYERLNGHLPMEVPTDTVSAMTSSAECYKEAKQQNPSEKTLTSGEMGDVNASVEQVSSDLDENLCEIVSAIQDKIVVKEDNILNTSTCEEVNVRPSTDDKEILQAATVEDIVTNIVHTHDVHQQDAKHSQEKDEETRECISTSAIEEKKMVASNKKEFPDNALVNEETICSDTDFSSLGETACDSKPRESSDLSARAPVVEELSQCVILKPQCDPTCCEGPETYHHATTAESIKLLDVHDASLVETECVFKPTETSDLCEPEPVVEELSQCMILKPQCDPTCCEDRETSHHATTTLPAESNKFSVGDDPSLVETACVLKSTDTSDLSLPKPVVEELSQCLILKPQCDPTCCEDLSATCHNASVTTPAESHKSPNESDASFATAEATQEGTQMKNSRTSPEKHYTLVLQSSEEGFCISGEHIYDPSPSEPTLPETFTEGQEGVAELNKDEPGTCIVTVEQREKVYEKQVPLSPLASTQEESPLRNESGDFEYSTASGGDSEGTEKMTGDDSKEGTVFKTNDKTRHSVSTAAQQSPTIVEEQSSIKEDTTQDQRQTDSMEEEPQEQKRDAIEQKGGKEHSDKMQVTPDEEQSTCQQLEVPEEQRTNTGEQEKDTEGEELSSSEQLVSKDEGKNSPKQQDIAQEQKQDGDEEKRQTHKPEENESRQEVVVMKQQVSQEKENDSAQEPTSKQEQNKKTQGTNKHLETTHKTEQESSGQHQASVEQKQGDSNEESATPREQEQKATQKRKESDKKQKVTQKQVKSIHKQDREMQKQEGSNNQQEVTQQEQVSQVKVTPPEQSAKDPVAGDEMALSPSKRNNNGSSSNKKGALRSHKDSASADLDCDLGSEQDNLNCDSSSLVNRTSL